MKPRPVTWLFCQQQSLETDTCGSTYFLHLQPIGKKRNMNVLCVGDSITAGFVGDQVGDNLFWPYADYLRKVLNTQYSDSRGAARVEEIGCCGITASQMVKSSRLHWTCGIRHTLIPGIEVKMSQMKPDLVVVMAGTNDLPDEEAKTIFNNITAIHTMCHTKGIPTICLSIPDSRYRHTCPPSHPYSKKWILCNTWLKEWCNVRAHITTFIDPLGLYVEGYIWAPDGLHLSKNGSETLAINLAVPVGSLLDPSTAATNHAVNECYSPKGWYWGDWVAAGHDCPLEHREDCEKWKTDCSRKPEKQKKRPRLPSASRLIEKATGPKNRLQGKRPQLPSSTPNPRKDWSKWPSRATCWALKDPWDRTECLGHFDESEIGEG